VAHWLVPADRPAVPAPAATLVLLRDRPGGGVEVLLMQRHRASAFAGGDYVFPGGKLEAADRATDAVAWCAGLDVATAARRLALDDTPDIALACWVGVIRETFEEVGILLAHDATGRPAQVNETAFAEYRRACQADHRAFWDMIRSERLRLSTDRVVYFAHWITPDTQPLRFDTRFFAAIMPDGQAPVADDREAIDLRWMAPDEAIAAAGRGELSLRNPTQKNLGLFAGAASASEALERVEGRRVVTVQPRVVIEGGVRRVILPDDAGYG
jgi:8-oxo-dGTP pyrophosphatase MutT (NUDIX family)